MSAWFPAVYQSKSPGSNLGRNNILARFVNLVIPTYLFENWGGITNQGGSIFLLVCIHFGAETKQNETLNGLKCQ